MKKGLWKAFIFLLISYHSYSQSDSTLIQTVYWESLPDKEINSEGEVYKLKPAVDIPLSAAAIGWTLYGFKEIYSKDSSTREKIRSLNPNNINGFDRWAADVYSEKAADVSDLLFYGSMPLPILLFADKDIRKDAAKVGFLYLETMAVTGVLYTGSAYIFDRYRPLAYNENAPMPQRTSGNAKNSFLAGHVALVGTATFFTAKIFADYHPDSNLKYWFYGGAAVATAATGYLRHRGGRHFPSDILVGAAVGTLSGILVPQFHKNKTFANRGLSIAPFSTGRAHGFSLQYKL